jgi:hypothetical protein
MVELKVEPAAAHREITPPLAPPALPPPPPAETALASAGAASASTSASTDGRTGSAAVLATGQAIFSAPVPLQVYESGQPVGFSGHPIVANAGVHTFDLLSPDLGLTLHRTVTVETGQVVRAAITLPMGQLSVNATPWADVWIDNTAAGETPLANVSLRVGPHEIVFRHPDMTEQHQTVIVRADGPTRISASMQR